MRSSKQKLYDNFYYGFERWLTARFEDVRARKRVRGVKFPREFYDNYKNIVRPYWARFGVRMPLFWVKDNYLTTGSLDPRYISNSLYHRRVIPYFNDPASVGPLTDKNLNSLLFPDAKRPETAFKYMSGIYRLEDFTPVTRAEAAARLRPGQDYVIKPARDSSGGHGVRFFTAGREDDEVLDAYSGVDYLLQAAVTQHPDLAALNQSSVNTIRIITLFYRGQAHVLAAILRIGTPGCRVDNTGSGGYFCAIRPDGTVGDKAYAWRNGRDVILRGEVNGVAFAGRAVPSYAEAAALAKRLAARTPHLALLAWDFAVDDAGDVVLIEFNAHSPTLIRVCGPLFGELSDDVFAEVFGKKARK